MQVFIANILLFPFNFDFQTNFSLRLNPFEISILFLSLSPYHLFHFFILSFIPMPSLIVCIVCTKKSMCPRAFPSNFKSSMNDKFLSLLLSSHSQLKDSLDDTSFYVISTWHSSMDCGLGPLPCHTVF